jgi:integrase
MKSIERGIQEYTTPSGEVRYRVRWRENGQQRSRSFSRLSGEYGARRFQDKLRASRESGSRLLVATSQHLTLAVFVAEVWAPIRERNLEASSFATESQIYNKHILHQLGGRPISQIDSEDVAEWKDHLEAAGVKAPTMSKAMGILSRIFREAATRNRSTGVSSDPVAPIRRPSAKRRLTPLVWGPAVVERVRYQLIVNSLRIGPAKKLAAQSDALLVSTMAMTGCRPGEALALRWRDVENPVRISRTLKGNLIANRTKTGRSRTAPLLEPLAADLAALRARTKDGPDEPIFQTPSGSHWVQTDWRNYRSRHFVPALERVEKEWAGWRKRLADSSAVRESITGLRETRPYDLGRHTHSALMLASGISLQRLARIHGHGIRVLDETYSEQLAEYEERAERIDPVAEIKAARELVWRHRDPSTGTKTEPGR